jgi:6-pyruvoyltetrahydropterin/6-carboxytetrahydropterin synthase
VKGLSFYLSRDFIFDAAHRIVDYSGKCEHIHGHTYKLKVTISGDIKLSGMVLDFAVLKKIVNDEVIFKLDHADLNEIFENPTTENIAIWIAEKLEKPINKLNCKVYEISLREGANNTVSIKHERCAE